MASVTPQLSNLPLADLPTSRQQPQMPAIPISTLEAKVESVVGINIVSLEQGLSDELPEEGHISTIVGQSGMGENLSTLPTSNFSANDSSTKLTGLQGQGQHFEPLDKSISQTVKLNPKMELSKADLLKLLSYMEAELQARDVVIATLKTERIKNLLHYGRVGINDPFLALQRDGVGGQVFSGGGVTEGELRNIEETQLQQLENLITQQRKAHQRMRQVLREAEKRHSWTVEELEKERKKHENDAVPDDTSCHSDTERSNSKQCPDVDKEKAGKCKAEKDLKKLQETLEEERGKQKQIILMLVEERKRLAMQYVEERKRSEDLAQILSEEKGRIDSMAEGLEEESKKSLQMEAELEKQLAEFDTEKQQMGAQIAKKDERIFELEALTEKLQREVEHYKKQLQEAHNVAMFQQTLSVSPPRIGIGTSPQRPQPPQLPVKPPSLAQGQSRLQATPAHSNVTKAVQLTATVNSVPVAGPTTGIARGVQPGIGVRSTLYSASASEVSRPITSTAKTYSESECAFLGGSAVECDVSASSVSSPSLAPQGTDRTVSRVVGGLQTPQVVQVSPRVNVCASSSNKVITTAHGGKVTFHVTTNAPSSGDQTILKKPAPPTRSPQVGPPPPVPLNKPIGAPPVPPNKPVVPPKKMVDPPPISVEVKPQKLGPQTVKFGITISKGTVPSTGGTNASSSQCSVVTSASSDVVATAVGAVSPVAEGAFAPRRENAQVEEGSKRGLHECVDSLCHELENFHQLLSSMADNSDLVENLPPDPHHTPTSGPALYSCDSIVASPPMVDGVSVARNTDYRELKNLPYVTTSPPLSTKVSFCQSPPHGSFELEKRLSSISSPLPLSSSSSLSSPSPLEKNIASYVISRLPVTSSPLVSESEESASAQACKSPPMSIPPPSSSSPCSSTSTCPIPPQSLVSSPIPSSSPTPRPCFLPVESALEINPEDGASSPHSPIDVATPLTADGMTALHLAAQGNNWQSVAVLVHCGSSVTAEDDEGRTPLYLALLYSCVLAAKALLAFPQCLEHTTKAGCNFIHAATKSGDTDCLSLIMQHILDDPEGGMPLLHLLVTSPDHQGQTPVALVLAAPSPCMAQLLKEAGLDLNTLIVHNPQLAHAASLASMTEIMALGLNEVPCSIWVQGIPLSSEKEERWAIGTAFIGPSLSWSDLEKKILSILTKHFDALDWCGRDILRTESLNQNDSSDVDSDNEEGLGLSETSVDCFYIGEHYWKKGDPAGPTHLPYPLLRKDAVLCGELSHIIIHLTPLSAVAYTCLTPVFLLENYLRLLDQSKCVVVYGAESSGKRTLARCLASLWSGSFADKGHSDIVYADFIALPLLTPSVDEALNNGRILVLERLPRDSWPLLWGALKRGSAKNGGRVLATMDNWRRPSGQLESEVLWVQLRHDRPPLRDHLSRFLIRQVTSMCAGSVPPAQSLCMKTIHWVCDSQARLSDTLMSLGFSTVLRGPRLLAHSLSVTFNPRDTVRAVEQVWNNEMVATITQEVQSVWKMSPLYGGERAPNETRVSSMALHVIFQRSFLSGWQQPPKMYLAGFQGQTPAPKDHCLKSSLSKPPPSPTSPEWNEDNLTKILGLPPMGYA